MNKKSRKKKKTKIITCRIPLPPLTKFHSPEKKKYKRIKNIKPEDD